jgi:hypothetical protein
LAAVQLGPSANPLAGLSRLDFATGDVACEVDLRVLATVLRVEVSWFMLFRTSE